MLVATAYTNVFHRFSTATQPLWCPERRKQHPPTHTVDQPSHKLLQQHKQHRISPGSMGGQATVASPTSKQPPFGIKAAWVKPLLYGGLNIISASGIVFANKAVFSTYGFKFTCALTWIHTMFTLVGMRLFLMGGMFQLKKLPQLQLLPLAAAYVGYIVLCNLSLNVNTVGFYQVMKVRNTAPTQAAVGIINMTGLHGHPVQPSHGATGPCLLEPTHQTDGQQPFPGSRPHNEAFLLCTPSPACCSCSPQIAVAPTVMVLDLLLFRVIPPIRVVLSVLVVCAGIGIATVTDDKIISNLFGLAVGMAATVVTAMYQIWAGSKQKELQASSMQLLHQYTPQAALLLGVLIPLMEPVGKFGSHDPKTLLGYK